MPELRQFITRFCQQNKVGRKALANLSLETSIYPELDLSDIAVDLFLSEFVERFNIDYSTFHWKNYGYPDGYLLIDILKLFGYQKRWVRRLGDMVYKPRFFVRNLQDAIFTGKLE